MEVFDEFCYLITLISRGTQKKTGFTTYHHPLMMVEVVEKIMSNATRK